MAHPIRPDMVIEMNNFYTLTVSEGRGGDSHDPHPAWRRKFPERDAALFQRHDGSAATCDDFVQAMEDASNVNLSHFHRWYSQSGTPVVTIELRFRKPSSTP